MLTQTVALTSVCSDFLESAFPFPTSDGNCACSLVVWAPGLWWNMGLSPEMWGNTQLDAKCWGCQCSPEQRLGHQLGQSFLSAKTSEKPQLEQVDQPQDARKEEEISLCAFWHLQCQPLSLLWFFSQCCNGLHFNHQGDLIILWCPTPIYKLYLRTGAVTPCAFVFPFPIMPYIDSIWYQDLKEIHLNPGQLARSRMSGKVHIQGRACPLVRISLPAGGKVLE